MKHLISILLIPTLCLGQNKINTTSKDPILKLNLTSLIDQFSFPTLQFSLEKKLSNNFSLAGEIGYQLYEFKRSSVDTSFIDKQGVKGNIEVRYYNFLKLFNNSYRSNVDLTGMYVGINSFYRQNKYNINVYYSKPSGNTLYNDCFWVRKNVVGVNLVVGTQNKLSAHVVLDLYAGLGALNRHSENFNREYNYITDSLRQSQDLTIRSIFERISLKENNGWKGSFNIGLRIGFKL